MGIPVISDVMDTIYDAHRKYADPRTKDWFMLWSNPIPIWILTISYLVFSIWLGPWYMKDRKPYNLRTFMVVYNLGLVVLSMYLVVEMLLSTSEAGYNWMCSPYNENTWKNPKELRVANVLWLYGFSKVIELLDTVLMILRKKGNQVTFLHLFHHGVMLNIWWWVPTFTPGGQTWFGSWLNCLVHVVMYSYYGLAVIPSLRDKLWWKKYITTFQLVQFVITFSHVINTYISGCDFPMWGQYLLGGFMVSMLILFGNFYFQQYLKKSHAKHHAKKTDSANGVSHTQHQTGSSHEQNGNSHEQNGKSHIHNGNHKNYYVPNGTTNGSHKRK